MIEESYVSLETAKLLKEAGFDWPCEKWFELKDGTPVEWGADARCNWNVSKDDYSRPTLSLASKWLREVKYLAVMPEFCFSCNWQYRIYLLPVENGYAEDITVGSERLYEAYEDALEAGMNEALEFLINKEK